MSRRALRREIVRLRRENKRLMQLNLDQARIIFTLRRVLRFHGYNDVVIEDEYIELGEEL